MIQTINGQYIVFQLCKKQSTLTLLLLYLKLIYWCYASLPYLTKHGQYHALTTQTALLQTAV